MSVERELSLNNYTIRAKDSQLHSRYRPDDEKRLERDRELADGIDRDHDRA